MAQRRKAKLENTEAIQGTGKSKKTQGGPL